MAATGLSSLSDKKHAGALAEGGRIDQDNSFLQIIIVTIWRHNSDRTGHAVVAALVRDG